MEKTIILNGLEYYLIPKVKKQKLPDGVEIEFEKIETKTYFDIKVRGWGSHRMCGGVSEVNPWILFRRIENADGSFQWTDYSTGGVTPTREKELIVETWYQNYLNSKI